MNLIWVLIIVLLVLAFAGAPGIGPINHNFGYAPSGLLTVIIIVLVILLLTGRL